MNEQLIFNLLHQRDSGRSSGESRRRQRRSRQRLAGRLAIAALLGASALIGTFLWYAVNYGHYESADLSDSIGLAGLEISEFDAIKGSASPLKFKACFVVSADSDAISSRFGTYRNPVPLVAPKWFTCFDAKRIGMALESGEARAYLISENVSDGIDRVAAVFEDGRAYAWHQLNSKFKR